MNKILTLLITFVISFMSVNGKSFGWGFSKNNNHMQPYIGSYEKEIEGTNSYYVGNKNVKNVFLTFDAGYDNGNMTKILDILQEKDVIGTFFITGDFITRFSDLVIEINKRGHNVGNHTWSHKNITKLSGYEIKEELNKLENEYKKLTNSTLDYYFRPPEGVFNFDSLLEIKKLNYKTIFWSIAYKDWDTNNQGNVNKAVSSVIDNLHNGAIILLHTVSETNVKALPIIIDEIRNNGYDIKSLDELFNNI